MSFFFTVSFRYFAKSPPASGVYLHHSRCPSCVQYHCVSYPEIVSLLLMLIFLFLHTTYRTRACKVKSFNSSVPCNQNGDISQTISDSLFFYSYQNHLDIMSGFRGMAWFVLLIRSLENWSESNFFPILMKISWLICKKKPETMLDFPGCSFASMQEK